MSMRSSIWFSITPLDGKPIAYPVVDSMLAATSYAYQIDDYEEHDDGCWVTVQEDGNINGHFDEVHPEEFEPAFSLLTKNYPDRTFHIVMHIHDSTEMCEAGETEWLEKNGKTCHLNRLFTADEIRLMPVILNFALVNVDEYHQALLDQRVPFGWQQIEAILRGMVAKFEKTKDVF